jgi:hypothetical protein
MPNANQVVQTITWTSGKKSPPKPLHGTKLAVWIYRPGLLELSLRIGRYTPEKGWIIDNTDNATVYWWARLTAPQEQP